MRYKTLEKLVVTDEEIERYNLRDYFEIVDNIVYYKIMNKFSVFYIRPAIYNSLVGSKILEISEDIKEINYETFRISHSKYEVEKLRKSLTGFSLLYLMSIMENEDSDKKYLSISVYNKNNIKVSFVLLNVEKEEIKKIETFDDKVSDIFSNCDSFYSVLDRVIEVSNLTYENITDIIEKSIENSKKLEEMGYNIEYKFYDKEPDI